MSDNSEDKAVWPTICVGRIKKRDGSLGREELFIVTPDGLHPIKRATTGPPVPLVNVSVSDLKLYLSFR